MTTGIRAEPSQRRSRDKRDRILVAVGELLEEVPFERITTKDIAARAGVSVGSLYRFFVDKQAVIDALGQHWLDSYVEIMDGALAEAPPDGDALVDQVVDAFAAFWRGEHELPSPGLRQIWFGPVKAQFTPGALVENDDLLVSRLFDVLTTTLGRPPTEQLRIRLRVAINVADDLLTRAFRANPRGDETILAELKELLRRYLA
ncbi:AcrR family transcriptional regulator [Allocatelliglobosispora scoriae]|uniref:AcrR family transcriptional regulator n=1 Tax=Allocatelliglobosispora scoriae TaxID=643052 RepID=A0A841C4Q6_9ACTN|nr:TetR/AcrR family transcriptional regulator [Allocatelliglobosispora scoriae]MBB5874123.1 AcrR family transcriptional regulator [Allocatelliglobosispora scoriae]